MANNWRKFLSIIPAIQFDRDLADYFKGLSAVKLWNNEAALCIKDECASRPIPHKSQIDPVTQVLNSRKTRDTSGLNLVS